MYCTAMGIPETVVRDCWCTLEELFAGSVKREGVVVHVLDVDNGVPSKEAKVFVVKIRAVGLRVAAAARRVHTL